MAIAWIISGYGAEGNDCKQNEVPSESGKEKHICRIRGYGRENKEELRVSSLVILGLLFTAEDLGTCLNIYYISKPRRKNSEKIR